jgi:hypothetical protein
LKAKDIHARIKLKKSQQIPDHMGSTELAANLFRATQTEEKLRRENIEGKAEANHAHFAVGRKVRQTIEELGGTMPEDLPPPAKSIQQLQRDEKQHRIPSCSHHSSTTMRRKAMSYAVSSAGVRYPRATGRSATRRAERGGGESRDAVSRLWRSDARSQGRQGDYLSGLRLQR